MFLCSLKSLEVNWKLNWLPRAYPLTHISDRFQGRTEFPSKFATVYASVPVPLKVASTYICLTLFLKYGAGCELRELIKFCTDSRYAFQRYFRNIDSLWIVYPLTWDVAQLTSVGKTVTLSDVWRLRVSSVLISIQPSWRKCVCFIL